jgi:hypothetical protein
MSAMLARKLGTEWRMPYRAATAPARSLTGRGIAITASLTSLDRTAAAALPTMGVQVFMARARMTVRSTNASGTLITVRVTTLRATTAQVIATAAHGLTVSRIMDLATAAIFDSMHRIIAACSQPTSNGLPATIGTRTMGAGRVTLRPGTLTTGHAASDLAVVTAPGSTT